MDTMAPGMSMPMMDMMPSMAPMASMGMAPGPSMGKKLVSLLLSQQPEHPCAALRLGIHMPSRWALLAWKRRRELLFSHD